MKKFLLVLGFVLAISVGTTATGAPIDTSPDIESVIDLSCLDTVNPENSVNVPCANASLEVVNFCTDNADPTEGESAECANSDAVSYVSSTTNFNAANAANTDPTEGESAECANSDAVGYVSSTTNFNAANAANTDPTEGESAECANTNSAQATVTIKS